MVIRDGNACGLIIKSGRIPSAVNGISSSGIMSPKVPFWPALEAILSPIAGTRSSRTRILAILVPSSPSVINDLSTNPNCPFLGNTDESTTTSESIEFDVTFPITTILSSSAVFSLITPHLSK